MMGYFYTPDLKRVPISTCYILKGWINRNCFYKFLWVNFEKFPILLLLRGEIVWTDDFSTEFRVGIRAMDEWISPPPGEKYAISRIVTRVPRVIVRIDSGGYGEECSLGDRIIEFFSPLDRRPHPLIAFQRHKFPMWIRCWLISERAYG